MTFFSDSINKLPITQIKIFFARILYRIVKLFYRRDIQLIKRDGIFYEVDLSEGIELSLFLFGNFQKHVSNNKVLQLAKDAVVFDIGANVGLMSLQFAQLVPEGRVYSWEAAHFAVMHKLDNLIVLIDKNGLQGFGNTKDILGDTASEEKWQTLGFEVLSINGHDLEQIINGVDKLKKSKNSKPKVIIGNTVKGKGVSFMENEMKWHYLPLDPELYQQAISDIKKQYCA